MKKILILLIIILMVLLNANSDQDENIAQNYFNGTFQPDTTEMKFDTSTVGTWKTVSFEAIDNEGYIKTDYAGTVSLTLNNSEAVADQVIWSDGTIGGLMKYNKDTGLTTSAYFENGKLNLKLYHELADSGLSITLSDEERNISITTSEFGFKPDIVDSMIIKIPETTIYAGVEYEYEIIPVDTFGNINYEDDIMFYLSAKDPGIMGVDYSVLFTKGIRTIPLTAYKKIDAQWLKYYNAKRIIDIGSIQIELAEPEGQTKPFDVKPRDSDPPLFTEFSPVDEDSVEPGKTNIKFVAYDSISGIKPSSLIMTFEGDTVISNYEEGMFKYKTDYLEKGNYTYTVELEDSVGNVAMDTVTFMVIKDSGVRNGNNIVPKSFFLNQNYPNPFNPTTTISYVLPDKSKVIISIYDLHGNLIETILDTNQNAGYHETIWNAIEQPTGVYLYKIKAGNFTEVKKCILIK